MKVVINNCWGGFSISRKAAEFMASNGSKEAQELLDNANPKMWYGYLSYADRDDKNRADPHLVAAVEFLGSKEASGSLAKLSVVEIPDGIDWYIHDYDGMEHVAQQHQTWG